MRSVGTFALAIVALGFGLTSVYFYRQLEAERSHARALQDQREVACDERATLQPTAAEGSLEAKPMRSPLDPSPTATPATSISAATSSAPAQPAFTFTDEQRDYFTRKRYSPLFRELGLSEDDISALVPLLREQEQRSPRRIPKSRVAADGSILPDPDEPRQRANDQAEIAALIGQERAAKLMESRTTLTARTQMLSLRARLDDTDEPITDEQMQRLMAAAKHKAYASMPRPVEGDGPDEHGKRIREWENQTDRQMRDDAAQVLTPNQMKNLDEEMAATKTMRSFVRTPARPVQPAAGAGAN